jgi:hypothetical protein
MPNSIPALLLRNLSDVFGENDPLRRRAAIDEIFYEDAVFYDPKGGAFRGRDEIDLIAGVIKATHPAWLPAVYDAPAISPSKRCPKLTYPCRGMR